MDAPKPSLPPRPTDTSINARSSAMSPPPTTALRDRTRTLSSRADPPASTPPLPRRRSSILSFSSLDDARNSVQSSAGDIIRPGADDVDDESSHWHSSPLAFAILPAIGGLLFHNGTAFVTDVLLLGLAAVFLNWSVRYPWDWYRSTQAVILPSSPLASSLVLETNEEEQASDGQQVPATDSRKDTRLEEGRADAAKRLRKYENLALMSTFVLPALGAYLLHVIRGQLSRPSTGLVSDYNLTIFLLAAEIRPVRQLIKLVTKRTLHLQRVANSVTDPALGPNRNNDILARLDLLEAKLAANDTLAPDASEIQKEEVASFRRNCANATSLVWML
ncbi:hypothetical protein H2203_000026 [Taxawa tesnikishii (nom. ined.)]|nr:hypothetical protein H2203_000026 [Dothideales sp. JES 119]